ncbi:Tetratricopeptide-like helical domain superfamily [Sesbania bispinosa]|nr:Tetratricopeptide-like helical domain superfamily [Sesbania bispinosa]
MDLRSRVQKTSSNNHILCSNAKIVPYVSSDETALLRENSRKFNLDLGRPNELFSLVKTIDLLLKPGVAQYFRSKGIDTSFMYEESGYLANVLDSHSVIFRDKKLNFAEVKEPIDEHTRKTTEANYAENPLDADNLTKWGGALIELSAFQNPRDSKKMIDDSLSKLEEALRISPTKHDTPWAL